MLPLALCGEGCLLRERALAVLDRAAIAWEPMIASTGMTVVEAALRAGIAVGPLIETTMMSDLPRTPGLPPLGDMGVWLYAHEGLESATLELLMKVIRAQAGRAGRRRRGRQLVAGKRRRGSKALHRRWQQQTTALRSRLSRASGARRGAAYAFLKRALQNVASAPCFSQMRSSGLGHIEAMIGGLRRDCQHLEPFGTLKAMPDARGYDNEVLLGEGYPLLNPIQQQDNRCRSFKRQDDLVAARVAFPFTASGVVGHVRRAVAVRRNLGECFAGVTSECHFRGSIRQVFQAGQNVMK